jgi:hypothetical protein
MRRSLQAGRRERLASSRRALGIDVAGVVAAGVVAAGVGAFAT